MGDWLEPLLRLVHYAALLGLFGWSAFRVIGLRRLDGVLEWQVPQPMKLAALAAPLVSAGLMAVSIAAMMGQPVTALDWSTLEAMIGSTTVGQAFVLRMAALLAALLAVMLARSAAALTFAALLYAAALFTLGWTGHAAVAEGALGLAHRIANGVHLIGAGLWLGAIGWFWALTVRARRLPVTEWAPRLLETMHRFAPLGVALVAVVTLTGIVNAQLIFGLDRIAAVAASDYGLLLAAKLVLVLAMLACGARNALIGRRYALDGLNNGDGAARALAAVQRSLTGELLFGLGVISVVAVLGLLSPLPM